jgi:hypothetical protein
VPNQFSSGKFAIAQCDRCNFRFKLVDLRIEIVKTKPYQVRVCKTCWDPDQPQLQLGMYPIEDPQAVRNPRPDNSYYQGGLNGLQLNQNAGNTQEGFGGPTDGSRVFQWGWNPIGGSRGFDDALTPNNLAMGVNTGTVTVLITRR